MCLVFHLWKDVSVEVALWMTLLEVSSEVIERQLIAIFDLAVVGTVLLDGIVGQMHESIRDIRGVELAG
jgi:hypothetical protein